MDLMSFISENNIGIIAAIYVLGMILKWTKRVNDKYIPVILLIPAITFALLTNDISSVQNIAQAIMQGIIITGVAVFSNQLFKQSRK